MIPPLDKLLAGADAALRATFRERCAFLGSPWSAYYAPATQGVIVDRADNPEAPIPAEWREIVRLSPAWEHRHAMQAIRARLETMPLGDAQPQPPAAPERAPRYFVTPAPGYYGDRSTVLSSHATLAAAQRAARRCGPSAVVRIGDKRKGDEWLRCAEAHYPVMPSRAGS